MARMALRCRGAGSGREMYGIRNDSLREAMSCGEPYLMINALDGRRHRRRNQRVKRCETSTRDSRGDTTSFSPMCCELVVAGRFRVSYRYGRLCGQTPGGLTADDSGAP